jgi:hypothetical protein
MTSLRDDMKRGCAAFLGQTMMAAFFTFGKG